MRLTQERAPALLHKNSIYDPAPDVASADHVRLLTSKQLSCNELRLKIGTTESHGCYPLDSALSWPLSGSPPSKTLRFILGRCDYELRPDIESIAEAALNIAIPVDIHYQRPKIQVPCRNLRESGLPKFRKPQELADVSAGNSMRCMRTLRHHIVLPLLSPLLIAGLAAPLLHPISHFAHELHSPYEAEHSGESPVFDTEECELCVLTATLAGIEFKAITVSPSYAIQQGKRLAPYLVYTLLPAPTDARAPPAAG